MPADYNDTTPAAPANAMNGKWQADPPARDPAATRKLSLYFPKFTGDTGAGGSMGLVPAPAAGDAAAAKYLHADGTFKTVSINAPVVGFVIGDGTVGVDVGPMLPAPRSGQFTRATIVVKASALSAAMQFTINKNGVTFYTSASIAAGTSSGTVVSATLSPALTVAVGDVLTIDITSGAQAWIFTAQLS